MKKSRSANHGEMMRIVDAWRKQGGTWPAPIREIVNFALKNGLYNVEARIRNMCAADLAKAMREEYIRDGKRRPVRKLHAARITKNDETGQPKQLVMWDDIDFASRDFMEVAFKGRRLQIVGECKQLHNDVEYFNNRKKTITEPIQLCFDFRYDIEEANMPDEYIPVRKN
ncbi:MAG: hypothetical protein L0220_27340 [Acidobacteria bacterium]|nr:hypothetical protein [Acidobacteriota bacterium]